MYNKYNKKEKKKVEELEMLYIDDYKKVRIYKIKRHPYKLFDIWAIHFKYEDRYFLLHKPMNDENNCTMLYERVGNKLEVITGKFININRLVTLKGYCWVYKNIDLFKFVCALEYFGFAKTEFRHMINDYKTQRKLGFLQHSKIKDKLIVDMLESRPSVIEQDRDFSKEPKNGEVAKITSRIVYHDGRFFKETYHHIFVDTYGVDGKYFRYNLKEVFVSEKEITEREVEKILERKES